MNTLPHLMENLLNYSINSYIIFSDHPSLANDIYINSKKYTNPEYILLIDKNENKNAIHQTKQFFKSISILPKIVIFAFPQTEYTINASLKFIEELHNNQYLFIINNNQQLPTTLLSRCLQIHNYTIDQKKYESFLQDLIQQKQYESQYKTRELYDFIKHLYTKYIKHKYTNHYYLNINESKLYNKSTDYTDKFKKINYFYNLYIDNNLSENHINTLLLHIIM
ncbi:MAG: hypothetical protein AAFO15_02555 [Pseudomonadota bacterium]